MKNKYSRVISNLHAIQDTACWLLHFRMGVRDVFELYTWTESSQAATASFVQCGCHARQRTGLTGQALVCDTAAISLSPLSCNKHMHIWHHCCDRPITSIWFVGHTIIQIATAMVKLFLCLIRQHAMKKYGESGEVAPHIHLGNRWRRVVNFTSQPFHFQYALDRRLDGS